MTTSSAITYGLELGIDTPDQGRVCALDHGPFTSPMPMLRAALAVLGKPANTFEQTPVAPFFSTMDTTTDQDALPISGATVYWYSDSEGTLGSFDLDDPELTGHEPATDTWSTPERMVLIEVAETYQKARA